MSIIRIPRATGADVSEIVTVTETVGEVAWVPLSSTHLAGGVKDSGSRITSVDTAWAISGSRASASVTPQLGTDGIPEGYTWAVSAAALFSDLGITESQVRNGEKSIIVGIRQRTDPGAGANIGVAFGASSGETGAASTLTGGGGGIQSRSSGTTTEFRTMAFDTTQEATGIGYYDIADAAAVVQLTVFEGYWKAWASARLDAEADLTNPKDNTSGFASRTAPVWLILWVGGTVATSVTFDADISFAATSGPNFAAVPA